MARFGRESTSDPQRFSDLEGASLINLSNDHFEEEDSINKNICITESARNPGDGTCSDLSEFAEYSRPRRRASWWPRLLMTVRSRKNYRPIEDQNVLRPSKPSRRRHVSVRSSGICLGMSLIVLAVLWVTTMFQTKENPSANTSSSSGIIHIWNYIIGRSPAFWDDGVDWWLPNWGEPGQPGEYLAHYPTDFTRDVLPIPCHSHNDYWRRIPLLEALHYGCTGVEADVWLFDEELYVGHDTASLTRNRTFRSLYVDPLVNILEKQNPQTRFTNSTRNGVFDQDPNKSLVLLVDFKTDGRAVFLFVKEHLSALREKNYLTYFDGENIVPGPITVVGTGNTPFDMVVANSTYRDIFFDAPLSHMWEKPRDTPSSEDLSDGSSSKTTGQGLVGTSSSTKFDITNSFYASVNFRRTIGILWRGKLSPRQLQRIRGQIQGAHARGLTVRYWNTPSWPIGLRNHIWHILVQEGADMLNVDDLRSAAKRDWRRRDQRERDL